MNFFQDSSDERCSHGGDGKRSVGVMVLPALKLHGKNYGRHYRVILEKSKRNMLRYYASIESRYGGNGGMGTE